jgi:hypothetical protein
MKFLPLLVLACAPACVLAQAGDPLKSAACGEALSALQQARGEAAANVRSLREGAASICLGASPTAGRSARVLQAPVAVPPPVIAPPPAAGPLLAAPALPPPPVAIERPATVTHCDATGCWASDGQHLQHLAPPLGLCTQQPGRVVCP